MNKFHTYFGQVITDTELNEIFTELTGGIERFIQDFGFFGIAAGAVVTRHEPANMTVDVSGPAILYDQLAQRLSFGSTQVVNCAQDENGVSTAVVGPPNARWLSIFAKFVSTPSDPRTDDLGATVFYRDVAGFQLRVAQGSEADAIADSPRAPLRGDQILIADVRIVHGQASIQAVDIDVSRTQTIYRLPGAPISIQARGLADVLQAMLDSLNTVRDAVDADFDAFQALINAAIATMTSDFNSQFVSTSAAIAALDGRVDALEDYEPPALPNFARRDQENTFAHTQTFENHDATRAVLEVPDAPSVAEKWRQILSFKNAGGQYVRHYVGCDDTQGTYAIVSNCHWDVGSQTWVRQSASFPSTALILKYGRLCVAHREASLAGWNQWDASPGGIELEVLGAIQAGSIGTGGALTAASVAATGNLTSSAGSINAPAGSISAGVALTSGGHIIAGNAGEFGYTGIKLRSKPFSLASAQGIELSHSDDGMSLGAVGNFGEANIPLVLPRNAKLGSIVVYADQQTVFGGAVLSCKLMKKIGIAGTATIFTGTTAVPGGTGPMIWTIASAGHLYDADADYFIKLAGTDITIQRVEMIDWEDPGYRG